MKVKLLAAVLLLLSATLFYCGCASDDRKDSDKDKDAAKISDETARNVILTLTCIPENDTVSFVYNYAENIKDGRGITFGIIGFTSGTFDGTELLELVAQKDPDHYLCKYIPAFKHIDSLHEDGKIDDVTGLENFIADFNQYGNDEVVKEAQLELLDELYWDPAMEIADDFGIELNITKGQMYDASVRHGASGAREIAERTNAAIGEPADGTDEIEWLKHYFVERKKYYEEEDGETGVIERIDILYQGILDSGNYDLVPPFNVKCYGSSTHTITGEHP